MHLAEPRIYSCQRIAAMRMRVCEHIAVIHPKHAYAVLACWIGGSGRYSLCQRTWLQVPGSFYGGGIAGSGRTYDVSLDGQRFLLFKEGAIDPDDPYAGLTRFHVVQHWNQELLERVPR